MSNITNKPRIPAKLSQPRLFNVIDRHRLFALLDEERANRSVVWIASPPGAGKTALVASYIKARGIPAIWYQVDSDDNDAASFFYYLGLAGRKAAGRKQLELPLLTPEYLTDLSGFARRFFRKLFASLPENIIIIMDNYHEVIAESTLHAIVLAALQELPVDIALLIISRTDPPPCFARAVANNLIGKIDWEHLRLTLEETRALVAVNHQMCDEMIIQSLQDRTNGWAAGVVLTMDYYMRTGILDSASKPASMELIFGYFAGQIFQHLQEDMRVFLMRTANLPYMTLKMAAEISGVPRAKELLDYLYRQQLFIDRRTSGEMSYRYHALFREFLLEQTNSHFSTRELHDMQRLGAILMESNGDSETAAELYAKAQAWSDLIRLINSYAPILLVQGRHQLLQRWIGLLPEVMIKSTSWLLYWRGVSCILFNIHAARSDLEHAYTGFLAADDSAGLFLVCGAMMEAYLYAEDNITPIIKWGERLQELLEHYGDFPSFDVEVRVFTNLLGLIFAAPHHPLLEILEARFESVLRSIADPSLRVAAVCTFIFLPLWRGDTGKMRRIINEVGPLVNKASMPPLLRILWKNIECGYAWHIAASPHVAEQKLGDAIQIAQESGISILNGMLWAHGAYSALSAGNIVAAQDYLDQLESNLGMQRKHDLTESHYIRAGIEFLRADYSRAFDNASTALKLHEETGRPFLRETCRFGLAQILIEMGKTEIARNHLDVAIQYAHAMNNPMLEHQCLLVKAFSWLKEGDERRALVSLQEGLIIGRKNNFLFLNNWWRPHVMTRIFTCAFQFGIEIEHVRNLIKHHDIKPESYDVENWPWPIKVYTLGRFDLLCNDAPLHFSRKAQHKPLELLKCLCAYRGRAVNQNLLTDALWPDSGGDAAEQAFRTTLHRLRKLLKYEQAIRLEDRHLFFDSNYIWVDCIAFDRIAHLPDLTDSVLLKRTLNWYHGHFLDGETSYWAVASRDRLRASYVGLVKRSGAMLEQNNNWSDAAACYLGAIEVEPLVEIFYQHLMNCYIQLGRHSEAITVYQRCRHILLSRLGISPGQEIQRIYQSLTTI